MVVTCVKRGNWISERKRGLCSFVKVPLFVRMHAAPVGVSLVLLWPPVSADGVINGVSWLLLGFAQCYECC